LTILQEIQKLNERVIFTENALPMMEDRQMNELKSKMEQLNDVIIKEIRSSFSVDSLTNLCKVFFYFIYFFIFFFQSLIQTPPNISLPNIDHNSSFVSNSDYTSQK
jgi:flagellar biosynthesis protein FlhB